MDYKPLLTRGWFYCPDYDEQTCGIMCEGRIRTLLPGHKERCSPFCSTFLKKMREIYGLGVRDRKLHFWKRYLRKRVPVGMEPIKEPIPGGSKYRRRDDLPKQKRQRTNIPGYQKTMTIMDQLELVNVPHRRSN
jgi:hypothetical protein